MVQIMSQPASPRLKSTQWLADNLGKVTVLDGTYFLPTEKRDARAEYLAGHIPGAVFFDIDAVADTSIDLPHMQMALNDDSAQVVDARSAGRFAGRDPEPRPGVRSGHMPGSRNVPFTAIMENGRLASAARIKEAFDKAGVNTDKPVITSCRSGVTAEVLAPGINA